MSIYIKGMKMPTSCDMCWALDDYGDYPRCRITEEQRGYNFPIREKRMDNCPLVPVPPHGDLIDSGTYRDEFMSGVYDLCNDDPDNNRANAIIDLFDSAPTIIPADLPKEEA